METNKALAAAVGLGTIMGVSLLTAPVAAAHEPSISMYYCDNSQWSARCGYGGVTNSHLRVYSCDTRADHAGFRTEYRLRNGATGYVDDADGSSSGCSGIIPGTQANPIVAFRVVSKQPIEPWKYSAWESA
ncbi:MAG TPA: hypothetical protein VGL02_31020 [Streptomyces sp.]